MADHSDFSTEVNASLWSGFFLRMQLILNNITNEHKNVLSILTEMCRSGRSIKHEVLPREAWVRLVAEGIVEQTDNIRLSLTSGGLAFMRELTGESESSFMLTFDTLDEELLEALGTILSSRGSEHKVEQAAINTLLEYRILYHDRSGTLKVNVLAAKIFKELQAMRSES